jgi:cytochrome c biogenesis protein CcmG, thiol:disulfide interchange protein DsbE
MNTVATPRPKRTFLGWVGAIVGFVVFVLAILFAAAFTFSMMADRHAEAEAKAKHVIDVALPDFKLPLLDEPARMVAKSDLLGAPYLVTTWASWCFACAHEHPAMQRLARSGRVRMIGLNMMDAPDSATTWLARHGNPYSMILVDEYGMVADRFGVMATPHHLLVDAGGIVRWRLRGTIDDEHIREQLLPLLDQLSAGNTRPQVSSAVSEAGASKWGLSEVDAAASVRTYAFTR